MRRTFLAAAIVAVTSVARAEPPAPPPQDRTPHPSPYFFDLTATLEFAPTRDVPPPLPSRIFAGATASFGLRDRILSLPPTYRTESSYRALGVGAGLQASLLSGRVSVGPTLRLSLYSFDDASPRRQLPQFELYAVVSPWVGAEDQGGTSWDLAWGSRFGVGVTALAWSSAVMHAFYCDRGMSGDGPPIGLLLCVIGLPVWGPVALLNHAEVFADVAHDAGQPLTPRLGFSFGFGF